LKLPYILTKKTSISTKIQLLFPHEIPMFFDQSRQQGDPSGEVMVHVENPLRLCKLIRVVKVTKLQGFFVEI